MEIADLHTHTRLCRHAEGSPEEFLAAALARGERYYGIADHCPFPSGFEPDWRMAESEFPEYRRIVGEMKRKAAGSGLGVLYGIEMDYVPGRRAEIEAKLAPEKMDYVIGSIHCVDGFCFDDPASLPVWESPGMAERIWKGYLRDLKIFVSEWNFQILGHPDLPKKFGYCAERTEEFFSSYREIFGIMKERGIALPLFSDVRSTEDFVRMRGMFRRIDRPCDWCMVDMRSRGRFPAHVGLYLDGSVIQAYETGVAVQPLGRVMPMVRGFYRPEIPS